MRLKHLILWHGANTASHGARCGLKIFEGCKRWRCASASSQAMGARYAIKNLFNRPKSDFSSGYPCYWHQKIFNYTTRSNIVTCAPPNFSTAWSKTFNRMSPSNIMTSGTRTISKNLFRIITVNLQIFSVVLLLLITVVSCSRVLSPSGLVFLPPTVLKNGIDHEIK